MTKQEAISLLDGEIIRCRMAPKINGCAMTEEWKLTIEVCEIAIEAIREQEARDKPKPLTMDELRKIAKRCEGVYVAHVDGSPVFRGKRYCAAVLDFSPAFGSNTLHVHAIYGDRLTLWEDDYGKTWLAYRSKPKEE